MRNLFEGGMVFFNIVPSMRIPVEGTQEEGVSFAVEAGLNQKEAEALFESLKGSELFWFERDGQTFWRWVRE